MNSDMCLVYTGTVSVNKNIVTQLKIVKSYKTLQKLHPKNLKFKVHFIVLNQFQIYGYLKIHPQQHYGNAKVFPGKTLVYFDLLQVK